MNKSQRIHFDKNTESLDSFIKIKLEQETDTLEFLTMNIDLKDAYQDFNADYGVLIGRVIANGGVGVPNAKISIFIPLTEEDSLDGQITSIYPYKTPRDKNVEGRRYNLLPRTAKKDPKTGIVSPKQPFGSFPIKEEIVTNELFLNVYKKYYKYTALTNSAGDYMIFGVPTGIQTVHMSVDITDIGKYSMNPASMVTNLGYSANLFTDDKTRIKPSTDLSDLPNIETQEISVNVIPFWGDAEIFEIGITRQDFRIRSVLNNTFIIFGTVFTDGQNAMWGDNTFNDQKINELYTMGVNNTYGKMSIQSKRIGKVTEKIYYYPTSVTDKRIDYVPNFMDLFPPAPVNPITDMLLLDPSEYSVYKRNGDFVFIINCNRNKIITDDFGNEIQVDDNSINGIFTKFRGFITLEITQDDVPLNWQSGGDSQTFEPIRTILKFPQSASLGQGLIPEPISGGGTYANNTNWRKQHYIFSGGTIYSIAKFNGVVYLDEDDNDKARDQGGLLTGTNNLQHYSKYDYVNVPFGQQPSRASGIIITNDITGVVTGNAQYEMVSNVTMAYGGASYKIFAANWLNFCAYLPQFGFVSDGYAYIHNWRSNTNFADWHNNTSTYYYVDNIQPIVAGQFNTKWFARSDLHWTDFVVVPKSDILAMASYTKKGFKKSDITTHTLTGQYKNGELSGNCPINGGKNNGGQTNVQDIDTYFYKGFKGGDCIQYMMFLGLV